MEHDAWSIARGFVLTRLWSLTDRLPDCRQPLPWDYFLLARDTPAIVMEGNWVSNFPERDFWPEITSSSPSSD